MRSLETALPQQCIEISDWLHDLKDLRTGEKLAATAILIDSRLRAGYKIGRFA